MSVLLWDAFGGYLEGGALKTMLAWKALHNTEDTALQLSWRGRGLGGRAQHLPSPEGARSYDVATTVELQCCVLLSPLWLSRSCFSWFCFGFIFFWVVVVAVCCCCFCKG